MRGVKMKPGARFGLLVTVAECGRAADGHVLWLCRCDCGNECVKQTNALKASPNASCGCYAAQRNREQATKHGYRGTPTYHSWRAAIFRCHYQTSKDYPRYGGRGIRVSDEWRNSFDAFLADMGERPANTTLDRIDTNGHYEQGNCRWATPTTQSRNRRRPATLVEWDGELRAISDIAAELGITPGAAQMRYRRGKLYAHR